MFAEAHGCTALQEAAVDYVRDHFNEVVQCEEFTQLSLQDVKMLLTSDYVHVTSEETVYNAMYMWLQHDFPKREKYAHDLLSLHSSSSPGASFLGRTCLHKGGIQT